MSVHQLAQAKIKPHIKLIETICLKRFNYTEEGHECFVYVLDKLMEKDYARINAFKGRSTFKTYLVSITVRLAIDFYHHRYGKTSKKANPDQPVPKKTHLKIVPVEDQEYLSDDNEKRPDEIVIDSEVKDAKKRLEEIAQSYLSQLSAEDRLLFKMKYEDNFKVSEIAQILKLDQKKTYRKISSILTSFKEKILAEHIDFNSVLEILQE